MPTTRRIPPGEWQEFFERFSKERLSEDHPLAATVEVLSPRLGDQYEVRAVRLLGLSYEPESESFLILLDDDVDHLVDCPGQIWVLEEEDGFISAMELACEDGRREIVHVWRSGPLAPLASDPMAGLLHW